MEASMVEPSGSSRSTLQPELPNDAASIQDTIAEDPESPAGKFREFTIESYYRLLEREERLKREKSERIVEADEGRLVDGEIVFDEPENEAKHIPDPKLADGQPLPEKLGRFPKELDGKPIEEIDKEITYKTFVIIALKFKRYHILRFSAERALLCLSPWNPLRKFCLNIISNQFFDWFILLTILVNCGFMMVQPSNEVCTLQANGNIRCVDYIKDVPEYLFQSIYTLELLIRVCARGLILGKHTYLRDYFNWLDFTVVIISYITTIIEQTGSSNSLDLNSLRAFRVLRVLKSISVVPGLRTIVNALFKSLRMLGEVMLLTLFCIAVFALLALQLYMGLLRQKCVQDIPADFPFCNRSLPSNNNITPCFSSSDVFRKYWLQTNSNYLVGKDGYVLCGNNDDAVKCPDGYFCTQAGPNPNGGYTHFDNFLWAMLNTLQLVSLDFWEDTYNMIIDVSGPWNMLFFLMVVLLGSFYLLNLMLAVVAMAYEQEADDEAKLAKEAEEEERARAKRKENTALLFDPKKLKQQLLQKQKEEEEAKKSALEIQTAKDTGDNTQKAAPGTSNGITSRPRQISSFSRELAKYPTKAMNSKTPQSTPSPEKRSRQSRPTTAHGQFLRSNTVVPIDAAEPGSFDNHLEVTELESQDGDSVHLEDTKDNDQDDSSNNIFIDDLPEINDKQRRYLIQKFATLWLNKIRPDEDKLIDRNCLICAKMALPSYHGWIKYQNVIYKVASDGLFELFITLCIACNTVIMATEYYNSCELCRFCDFSINATDCSICEPKCQVERISLSPDGWMDGMPIDHAQAMNIANVVFTIIFTVEAAIKLTGYSKEYFYVGWNIFDLVIVALSLPDLIIYFMPTDEEIAGLNQVSGIIKIFRLLRIIKLAQSWSTMRTLLGIIFGALGALANLSLILLIIVFIFAVLGNQLLGTYYSKFLDPATYPELAGFGGELPRWHFNDFFHSFLMVFRVLCGEWIEPLWDCMMVTSQAGCIVLFLGTLILGNFMVFNLFLALLLNSFSTDTLKSEKPVEEVNKVKKSLKRILLCFKSYQPSQCCVDKRKHIQDVPPEEKNKIESVTRLELILERKHSSNGLNGSHLSVASHRPEDSLSHRSNGELKPGNGGIKSCNNSTSSVKSNGVFKNSIQEMSPSNLQQIEAAFSVKRDQYTFFETAITAPPGVHSAPSSPNPIAGSRKATPSPRAPIIITEDFSTEERRASLYMLEEQEQKEIGIKLQNKTEKRAEFRLDTHDHDRIRDIHDGESEGMKHRTKMDSKSEQMVADDGNIIAPDCFWPVCYKNPNIGQCDNSCWQQYRLMCARIVTHKAFEGFIIVLILVSSGVLCFEGYKLHEQPELKAALSYLNIVFTVFFFIEMVLKLFAFGFKKYFTTFWSILDFVIVLISIIDVIGTYMEFGSDISMVRVLRTLRALRPLRAVSRWESMTIIVNALIFAMPAIGNVLLVCIVFWLIFVIMGVQLFRGKLHYCRIGETRVSVYNTGYDCTNTTIPANLTGYRFPSDLKLCNNSIMTSLLGDDSQPWHWAHLCMRMGGEWYRPKIHFDHVGHGYLALYQTATFEGWMEVMEGATDSPPYLGEQAFREASLYTYIYFILFIIFGAYFTLNLFIGVIIENFNVLKKQYDGSYLAMFLTTNQRNYYTTLKKLSNKKPQKTIRRPKSKLHAFFFDVAVNTKFEITITSVIFFNMVAMMLEYEPEQIEGTINRFGEFVPKSEPMINYVLLFQTLEYINITFTVIFALEAAIKIIGLRLHYFRRAWNVFDFVVVFLSIIGILLDNIVGNAFISPTLLRVVRVFRIGRVLRLVKAAKGIRKLLFALIISIPALFNIACLLFLFMFMFAIVGMALFMHVGHQGALTSTVNFETFGRSMVLLFRLCTSGGWNDVIDPLMEDTNCNSTHYVDSLGIPQERNGGDCGNKTYAVIFFLLYLFISFMIIINMYIAVILENFSQAHEQEEIGITEDDMDMFYIVWEKYDPHATQYIKLEELSAFIDDLEAPLGIPKPNGMAIVAFNLPIVEGDRIHCLDVLMALVKRVLHKAEADESKSMTNEHQEANEKLKSQIADKYKSAFPQRQHVRVVTTTMQRKKEDVAAKTLQRAWRKHKMKQNIMRIKELALESSQNRDSLSHRLSDALVNIRSRIGSALSRISGPAPRRGSGISQYSADSATKTPRNTSRPGTPISKRLHP